MAHSLDYVEISFPHSGFKVEVHEGESGEIDTTVIRIPLSGDSVVVRDGLHSKYLLASVRKAVHLHGELLSALAAQ